MSASSRSASSATRCCARPAEAVVDFDKELRVLVKDLTETMLDAPGAGLAAPQIGVGLRVFTYDVDDEVGHLINPTLDLSDEEQDGEEGCLSFPGLAYDTKRAWRVVAKGFNMHGEPVTIEGTDLLARCVQHETDHLDGILFIDRLDAKTRKVAMKAIREAEWGDAGRADRQGQPARHRRQGALADAPRLRRYARGGAARRCRPCSTRGTRSSPSSPAPTRPPGRGRKLVASPVAELAAEAGIEVLKPDKPRDAGVPRAAAPSSRRTAPRSSPTARSCRAPRSTSRGTAGSTCTSRCCPPGAAPRRCSTRVMPATRSPARPPSCSRRAWTPVRSSACSPRRSGPTDTSGDLLGRLAVSGAELLVRTLDGIEDGTLVPEPQPADGVSLAPKVTVEDARVDWTAPALAVDRLIRGCTPAPGAWTTFRGERLKLGPVELADVSGLAPGELAGRARPRCSSAPAAAPRCGWARCSRRASG